MALDLLNYHIVQKLKRLFFASDDDVSWECKYETPGLDTNANLFTIFHLYWMKNERFALTANSYFFIKTLFSSRSETHERLCCFDAAPFKGPQPCIVSCRNYRETKTQRQAYCVRGKGPRILSRMINKIFDCVVVKNDYLT